MPTHWFLCFLIRLIVTSRGGEGGGFDWLQNTGTYGKILRRFCCSMGQSRGTILFGGWEPEETQPAYEPLRPQKVRFQSRNFHNILHWQPGRTLADNSSVYFVQYKMYGERQWKNKEGCWGTPALFCDLTNETSDLEEPYYGRVRMARAGSYSGWSLTPRFTPVWETTIDPPVVTVTQVNASLLVGLHAPNLPYRNQNRKNISMEDYYEFVYRVFIINNSLKKEHKVYEGTRRTVQIQALIPHSSYCVVAEIYQPMLDRRSQRSKERCMQIL